MVSENDQCLVSVELLASFTNDNVNIGKYILLSYPLEYLQNSDGNNRICIANLINICGIKE